jgi:thioredoxin-like negative regulator of GroEL
MSDGAPAVPVAPFLSRRDKLAGLIAGVVAWAVYLGTLAPSVTLDDAGELLTAAHGRGGPHSPGYPIWTLLAWLWQHLIPFGNIAWRVNLMSATFGAAACGLTALLISSSGHRIARRVGFFHEELNRRPVEMIVLASAVAAALMLAFSPVMWSQSVVSGPVSVNAFFLLVTLLLLYRWSFEKDRRWRLYLAAFVWSASLTNQPTLMLLAVVFPLYVSLVDPSLGRDTLVPVLVVLLLGVVKLALTPGGMFYQGPFSGGCLLAVGVGAGVWLYFLVKKLPGVMSLWRPVLALAGAVLFGLAPDLYQAVALAPNPLLHTERTLVQFWGQLNLFTGVIQQQFNIVFALVALGALLFYRDLPRRERDWLKFLLIAFFVLGIGFIFFANPAFAKQPPFTGLLPGHCLYALWIGYGMILGLGYVLLRKPTWTTWTGPVAVAVALLPAVAVVRHWAGAEQRGHDFGYQLGYLLFQPGGGYPNLEPGAMLAGDTGLAAYMIAVESQSPPRAKTQLRRFPGSGAFDRRDVSLIGPDAPVEMIFEKNKDQHAFYVAGGDILPWMFPYLEPAGIVLKLHRAPVPGLGPAIVARDRQYWEALTAELQARPEYRRDVAAQQMFAKLRAASGSVYAFRKMFAEAQAAYRQAWELCPDSPAANFGLAQLAVATGRPDDGLTILEAYLKRDPYNAKIHEAIRALQDLKKQVAETVQLEQARAADPNNVAIALQLLRHYVAQQRVEAMDVVANALINRPDFAAGELLNIVDAYAQLRQLPRVIELLNLFTQRYPDNPTGWYDLAIVQAAQNNCELASQALEQALAHDLSGQLRNTARQDSRFAACRNYPRFNAVLGQLPATLLPPAGSGLTPTLSR